MCQTAGTKSSFTFNDAWSVHICKVVTAMCHNSLKLCQHGQPGQLTSFKPLPPSLLTLCHDVSLEDICQSRTGTRNKHGASLRCLGRLVASDCLTDRSPLYSLHNSDWCCASMASNRLHTALWDSLWRNQLGFVHNSHWANQCSVF